MTKQNVTGNPQVDWDRYVGKPLADAAPQIWKDGLEHSLSLRTWYWESIQSKKNSSLLFRAASFALLILGAVLPLLAGIAPEPIDRLAAAQIGISAIAAAGLLQAADKIFGWSSGWLRYIGAVTALEGAAKEFQMAWAQYVVSKQGALEDIDKVALFQLAKAHEAEVIKIQNEETAKWQVDFSASMALLGELIKNQKESSEKFAEVTRTAIAQQQTDAKQKAAGEAAGAIEITLSHVQKVREVSIGVNGGKAENFLGTSWARSNLSPGQYRIDIETLADPKLSISKMLEVKPSSITSISVPVP